MAYTTWAKVAETVEGEKRLLEILKPSGDTASDHPFFDAKLAMVSQLVNQKLSTGGWDVPLDEPLADLTIENDVVGLLVGELTRAYDGRAPWMDAMESAARDHLDLIAAGGIVVIGAEPEEDPTQAALMEGAMDDERIFDQSNPYSAIHSVFGSLRVR